MFENNHAQVSFKNILYFKLNDLLAGADGIGDMLFEVLKYDVFGNGTVGDREIPTAPQSETPIAFLQLREFTLHLVGRAPFYQPHQIAHRQLGRDRYKHVDVI